MWDFQRRNVGIVKVGGKGSFSRYRKFFEECGVFVKIVADLDVLADQFSKLDPSGDASKAHSDLLQAVDERCVEIEPAIPTRKARSIVESGNFRSKYDSLMAELRKLKDGKSVDKSTLPTIDALLNTEQPYTRRQVLAEDASIADEKMSLIKTLRKDGVYVLSRGAIEQYYPAGVSGQDKPTKALSACELVGDRASALACSESHSSNGNSSQTELEAIFAGVFDDIDDAFDTVSGKLSLRTEVII